MRIFVVSGYGYWGHFLPTDLGGEDVQVGGGETAMVQLSKQLAKLGHQVIVFHDIERPGKYDGVDYLPTQMFMYLATQMEHDVLVTWDYPPVFRFADRGKVHVVAYQLNDTVVGIYDHVIDRYFHPSSAITNTTFPSPSSSAIRTATEAIAPEDTPAKIPSSEKSFCVHTIASRFETRILRSSRERSMIGGMNPSSSDRRPWTKSPCNGSAATIVVGRTPRGGRRRNVDDFEFHDRPSVREAPVPIPPRL